MIEEDEKRGCVHVVRITITLKQTQLARPCLKFDLSVTKNDTVQCWILSMFLASTYAGFAGDFIIYKTKMS